MTDLGQRGWWGRAGLLGALSLAAVACGSVVPGGDPAETATVSSDGIIVCNDPSVPSANGEPVPAEWYQVPAMNNKLRHFPDFARVAPVTSVTNCAEARLFYDSYYDYSQTHPGFDQDEATEPSTLPPVPEPEIVDGVVDKIEHGTGGQFFPVVGLTNTIGGFCTGTFIAKNYVLTAAHCMSTAPGYVRTKDPESKAKVHTWYDYLISYAGTSGVVTSPPQDYPQVLQTIDPHYIGFRAGAHDAHAFDAAVLYVHPQYDFILPDNDGQQHGISVPYMRLSLGLSVNAASSTIWGYGMPETGKTLQQGDVSQYSFAAVIDATNKGAFIQGTIPSDPTQPHICHGDSGGPLVDRYDIADPITGVPQSEYVEAGILATFDLPDADCARVPDAHVGWVRTESERRFIGDVVSSYYPLFRCTAKVSASSQGGVPDYMECWGKPCKDATKDCNPGQQCFHPDPAYNGQCMPKPKPKSPTP